MILFKKVRIQILLMLVFVAVLFGASFINKSNVRADSARQAVSCDSDTVYPQQRNQGTKKIAIFCPDNSDIKTTGFPSQTITVEWQCPRGVSALQDTKAGPPKTLELKCSDGTTRPTATLSTPTPATPTTTPGGGGGAASPCTELAIKINGQSEVCGRNRLLQYVSLVVRFLTLGIGIVVVIMIIIGGIQYTSSSGDPGAVAAAKSRIFNALLALILFIFAVAILNWLVPGGIV